MARDQLEIPEAGTLFVFETERSREHPGLWGWAVRDTNGQLLEFGHELWSQESRQATPREMTGHLLGSLTGHPELFNSRTERWAMRHAQALGDVQRRLIEEEGW